MHANGAAQWWRNTLGLTSGEFYTSGAHNRSQAVTLTQRPSLAGRYHDGDVRCAAAGGVAGCRGFIEAT